MLPSRVFWAVGHPSFLGAVITIVLSAVILEVLAFKSIPKGFLAAWFFRWATPKKLLIFAAFATVFFGLPALIRYGSKAASSWRHPASRGPSPQGLKMMKELEQEKSQEVANLYNNVVSDLMQAQKKGINIDRLKEEADAALVFNTPDYRYQAIQLLNQIRLSIPLKNPDQISRNPAAKQKKPAKHRRHHKAHADN